MKRKRISRTKSRSSSVKKAKVSRSITQEPHIPLELVQEILKFVESPLEVYNISLTCKAWRDVVNHPPVASSLWRRLHWRSFGNPRWSAASFQLQHFTSKVERTLNSVMGRKNLVLTNEVGHCGGEISSSTSVESSGETSSSDPASIDWGGGSNLINGFDRKFQPIETPSSILLYPSRTCGEHNRNFISSELLIKAISDELLTPRLQRLQIGDHSTKNRNSAIQVYPYSDNLPYPPDRQLQSLLNSCTRNPRRSPLYYDGVKMQAQYLRDTYQRSFTKLQHWKKKSLLALAASSPSFKASIDLAFGVGSNDMPPSRIPSPEYITQCEQNEDMKTQLLRTMGEYRVGGLKADKTYMRRYTFLFPMSVKVTDQIHLTHNPEEKESQNETWYFGRPLKKRFHSQFMQLKNEWGSATWSELMRALSGAVEGKLTSSYHFSLNENGYILIEHLKVWRELDHDAIKRIIEVYLKYLPPKLSIQHRRRDTDILMTEFGEAEPQKTEVVINYGTPLKINFLGALLPGNPICLSTHDTGPLVF